MTIKIYGRGFTTATMRVLACLNEKGLDYEFIAVDMLSGAHRKDPFLSLSPFGQVPAFEDGDLKLFESRAINRYIAAAYAEQGTQLIFSDAAEAAVAEVWAEVEAQRYEPPATKLARQVGINPYLGRPTDEAIVAEQLPELAKVLDVYEARLAESKYLGGVAFTLADLHHLPTLMYMMASPPVRAVVEARPHVAAWVEDLMARPSWLKVLTQINI